MSEPPSLLEPSASGAGKRRLVFWGRLFAWAALLGCLVLFARSLHWSTVKAAFTAADLRLALLALLTGLPCTLLQGLRWFSLVRAVERAPPLTVLAATYVGAAASAVLPMRAGEAVRVELLSRATGLSRAVSFGTLAIDHTVNGMVMFLFAAALPLLLPVPRWLAALIWGGALAAAGLVLFMLRLGKVQGEKQRQPVGPGLRGRIDDVVQRLRGGLVGLRNPRASLPAALASAGAWGLEIYVTMLALEAFQLPHDLAHAMGVLFGVNLAQIIPALPANLGNFELGAGMALVAFGGSSEKAAAFALGFHAMQLFPTLLGGALFLPFFRPARLAAKRARQRLQASPSTRR